MRVAQFLLWLAVAIFGGFGLAFTLWPAQLAGSVGIMLRVTTAQTDFAATYGGMQLGLAAFLAWCAIAEERVIAGLVAAGCALAGSGVVRLIWIAATGGFVAPLMWQLAAIELAGAVVAFWASLRALTATLPRT